MDTANRRTMASARVSSHDRKEDLERQKQVLELFYARQGWTFEVVAGPGSGVNSHKKGLKRLLGAIIGVAPGHHPQGPAVVLWGGTGFRHLRGEKGRGRHPQPRQGHDF